MTRTLSKYLRRLSGTTALMLVAAAPAVAQQQQDQPNVLLILADDMGYSDIGAFGGEIETSNIDRLASGGMVMTQFHAGAVCNITRLQLMAGIDNNIAADPKGASNASRTALRHDALTLGEVMQSAGYETLMAGKWDLGQQHDQWPYARGFDHSFVMLPGTAAHFDEKPLDKRQPVFAEGDQQVTELPDDYYSTRYFTDKTLEYLKENEASGKPFFAYLAYTAPHFPLQAPKEYIDKYEGVYDEGYKPIRDKRLEGMKASGILPADMVDAPLAQGVFTWEDWPSAEEQKYESRRMAVYAAMVDYMDDEIGRVLDYLEGTGELDNTLIIFTSDNGASGEWKPLAVTDYGPDGPDNSYENLGGPGSNVGAGPGWGWVMGAPLKGYKTMSVEGGHSVPAIAYLPGKIEAGSSSAAFTTVRDLLPTFLDAAGAPMPEKTPSGQPAVPVDGKSFLPVLLGQSDEGPHAGEPVAFHDADHLYLFRDNWKLLSDGESGWQLYDLSTDRAEQNDLAGSNPEMMSELMGDWEANEARIEKAALPK
jgi:arylsulfatase A-like enzyme